MRHLRPIALALLVVLAAAGCKDSQRRNVAVNPDALPLALVNNERITQQEFQAAYREFLARWERVVNDDADKRRQVRELVLQQLINEKLLDQEARRRGISLPEKPFREEVAGLLSPMTEQTLRDAGVAGEKELAEWHREMHRRLVHRKLVEAEVVGRIRITQRELRAFYERNPALFDQPEQVRVRHIAVNNRSLYNRVRRRLNDNEDFVQLVREYSITPDRNQDGDLGYVERGVLPPEFDQVIFDLPHVGAVAAPRNPVQTQLGYHIFRLEGRRPATRLTFEEAVPRIREILTERKETAAYQQWLDDLRSRASIHIEQSLLDTDLG